jgi:hypothetical protein
MIIWNWGHMLTVRKSAAEAAEALLITGALQSAIFNSANFSSMR